MKKLIITTIPIAIGILLLIILSCCTKDDLKPEDYKFYCKVDGVEWKRTSEGGSCPGCTPLTSEYYPNGSILAAPGKFEIIAHRNIESKEIRQKIYIYIYRMKEGENKINILRNRIYIDYNGFCYRKQKYVIDSNFNNSFYVDKIDTIERSIKGTFDMRVISDDCSPPDTILISDGHFDLHPVWHP